MGYQYPRQAILAPIGLVTEPNEYNQYPAGALKTARNMVLRAPGKLEQAPNIRNLVEPGAIDSLIHKLIPADTGIVYAIAVDDTHNWVIFADGVTQSFVGSSLFAFSETGRISWAQCVERVIVNGEFGCLVRDPVPLSTKFRAAGLPQPAIAGVSFGTPGWLANNQMVGYRACLVRRYPQDYTLRSVPSVAVKVFYSGGTAGNVLLQFKWPVPGGIEPGDILEVYRTDILATTSADADPGATYKLVQEYALLAPDIAAGSVVLTDTQAPVTGTLKTPGRELYVNPGVEGETYGNLRPPIAECLASFKGFCFYGNTTERAQLIFSVPAGLGPMASAPATPNERLHGIGLRFGAGTVTSGSAVVTAVSAADMVGVKVGQLWARFSSGFPDTATVISVAATSFTMSAVSAANLTQFTLSDTLQINGVNYHIQDLLTMFSDLNGAMEAQISTPLPHIGAFYLRSFEVTLMWNYHPFDRPISVRATNGANYSPPLPEATATAKAINPMVRKNRLTWSKEQQPEHAPSVSETLIGFGEMYALNATRDALWIWCSDGLFRLSGNAGSLGLGAWQTDFANSTLLLCAPQASTVLTEKLYGYTNEGVVEIDSAGNISHKTAGIIGDLLPGPRYEERFGIILERNEKDSEVLLAPGDSEAGGGEDPIVRVSNHIFIYNVRSRGWTQLDDNQNELSEITAMAMFRLPPAGGEAHVLFAALRQTLEPSYGSWNAQDSFLEGDVQYQPIYGDDPLELKRWMWADYLFDQTSLTGTAADAITALWNSLGFGPVPFRRLDAGVYARAGCPRSVGLSHSIMPGFSWAASTVQRAFEGISIAVKQRTNQSKAR